MKKPVTRYWATCTNCGPRCSTVVKGEDGKRRYRHVHDMPGTVQFTKLHELKKRSRRTVKVA